LNTSTTQQQTTAKAKRIHWCIWNGTSN